MKLPTQPKQYNASFEQQRSGIIERALGTNGRNFLQMVDPITAPGASEGAAKIYVDAADGDLKVVFSNGTVKTLATNP